MLFTTNKALKDWAVSLHDNDLPEAILDHLLERGRIIALKAPSMRTRHLNGIDYERLPPTHLLCRIRYRRLNAPDRAGPGSAAL